jgi:hypothetical protein
LVAVVSDDGGGTGLADDVALQRRELLGTQQQLPAE